MDIEPEFNSYRCPSANGIAERFIKACKRSVPVIPVQDIERGIDDRKMDYTTQHRVETFET